MVGALQESKCQGTYALCGKPCLKSLVSMHLTMQFTDASIYTSSPQYTPVSGTSVTFYC